MVIVNNKFYFERDVTKIASITESKFLFLSLSLIVRTLLFVVIFFLGACVQTPNPEVTEEDIAGSYYNGNGAENYYIELKDNGTYVYRYSSHVNVPVNVNEGIWHLSGQNILFSPKPEEKFELAIIYQESDFVLVPVKDLRNYEKVVRSDDFQSLANIWVYKRIQDPSLDLKE